ncbi:MAG: hypothetical protein AB1847_04250 [bacterium]
MAKRFITMTVVFGAFLLLLSFHPAYADAVNVEPADEVINTATVPEGTDTGGAAVEKKTTLDESVVKELVDIYYNRPQDLPQDDESMEAVRKMVREYELKANPSGKE